MSTRWIVASVVSLALAFLTLRGALPRLKETMFATTPRASSCDPNAKAANLDFTVKDVQGADVAFSQFKGKVILLNFWATWCGPCKYEIPALMELQNQYGQDGLQVLGLSVDDPVDLLKPFAEELKMNYPVLVGLGHEDIQKAYGPMWGIPVTALIGRDGMICKKFNGISTKEHFEQQIKPLL